jgi:fluoride exporter
LQVVQQLFLVCLGGAFGAAARWQLGAAIFHRTQDWNFPVGTFTVNVLGCFLAGILLGVAARFDAFSSDVRLFLFTGVLGGFTTFSAFGIETVALLRRESYTTALLYVLLSVTGGVVALWLGVISVRGNLSS